MTVVVPLATDAETPTGILISIVPIELMLTVLLPDNVVNVPPEPTVPPLLVAVP